MAQGAANAAGAVASGKTNPEAVAGGRCEPRLTHVPVQSRGATRGRCPAQAHAPGALRGAGGHGRERAALRNQLLAAAPERLGPPGGCHPQRLEDVLAVGGQGENGADGLPRGGGRGHQHLDAAAD